MLGTKASPKVSSIQIYALTKLIMIDEIPLGQVEKVGEIDCYTATPTGDFPKDKVLLFLADGFGINLINSKVRLFKYYQT